MAQGKQHEYLLKTKTATGAGSSFALEGVNSTFMAHGTTSSGAGSATIKVQVSNDPTKENWLDLGTITLTLATTTSSDGFAAAAPWEYVRGNVTAISGTGASVNLVMGV